MGSTGIDVSAIASNPAWALIHPILTLFGIAILIAMVWRVSKAYFRGDHAHLMTEVIFGLIAVFILMDPLVFLGMVSWLITQMNGAGSGS